MLGQELIIPLSVESQTQEYASRFTSIAVFFQGVADACCSIS